MFFFIFILFEKNISVLEQVLISCLILVTLINCGAIMEQKIWIVYLEFSRFVLAGICLLILSPTVWLLLSMISLVCLIYYYSSYLQIHYLRFVYAKEIKGVQGRRA